MSLTWWRSAPGILLVCVVTHGCGWQKTMTFPAPSEKNVIEIWQTRIDNSWGTRVQLITPQKRGTVFENRGETVITFVHVYWTPDEHLVGVLATGLKHWGLAFNVQSGERVPFELVRDELAASIRKTYHVPADEKDPLTWTAMTEAQQEFFKLHPEINLTTPRVPPNIRVCQSTSVTVVTHDF